MTSSKSRGRSAPRRRTPPLPTRATLHVVPSFPSLMSMPQVAQHVAQAVGRGPVLCRACPRAHVDHASRWRAARRYAPSRARDLAVQRVAQTFERSRAASRLLLVEPRRVGIRGRSSQQRGVRTRGPTRPAAGSRSRVRTPAPRRERDGRIHVVVERRFHARQNVATSPAASPSNRTSERYAFFRRSSATIDSGARDSSVKFITLRSRSVKNSKAHRLRIVTVEQIDERLEVAQRLGHLATLEDSAGRRAPRSWPSADAPSAARSARSRFRDAGRSDPRRRHGCRSPARADPAGREHIAEHSMCQPGRPSP